MKTTNIQTASYFTIVLLIIVVGWLFTREIKKFSDTRLLVQVNVADVGFAQDMSIHHDQAVEMSLVVMERSNNAEVYNLAFDIANTQSVQRGMMLGWLQLWGEPLIPHTEHIMAWMGHGRHMHGDHAHDSYKTVDPLDERIMLGMASQREMQQLRASEGIVADRLFLNLMRTHHVAGVDMAQGVINRSDNIIVTRLAQTMVDAQEEEIVIMDDLLERVK